MGHRLNAILVSLMSIWHIAGFTQAFAGERFNACVEFSKAESLGSYFTNTVDMALAKNEKAEKIFSQKFEYICDQYEKKRLSKKNTIKLYEVILYRRAYCRNIKVLTLVTTNGAVNESLEGLIIPVHKEFCRQTLRADQIIGPEFIALSHWLRAEEFCAVKLGNDIAYARFSKIGEMKSAEEFKNTLEILCQLIKGEKINYKKLIYRYEKADSKRIEVGKGEFITIIFTWFKTLISSIYGLLGGILSFAVAVIGIIGVVIGILVGIKTLINKSD